MTSAPVPGFKACARRAALGCLVALALGTASPARAAPCSGFTDVDDASSSCPSVEWLRNRAVTLGCTPATLFCPSAAVIRLSMAAFMNRLGTALSPTLYADDGSGASLDLANPPETVCVTPAMPALSYPTIAHSSAVFTAKLGAPVTVRLRIVTSNDGGMTWTPLTDLPPAAGGNNSWVNLSVWNGNKQIPAGSVYRIGARADAEGAGALVGAWICQLHVARFSNTGNASPY